MQQATYRTWMQQTGLTLVELMVSIAIGMTVMSGVVQVLVVSKSNFVTERELAALQENARFAIKFLTDEIRMAGYSGCSSTPLYVANSIQGSSASWFLNSAGLQGFEYDAGIGTFPTEFRSDVAVDTDAIVIRRGVSTGLSLVSSPKHTAESAVLRLNKAHSYQRGQVLMVASSNCQNVGVFQMSNPANNGNNATTIVHNTGNSSPGNCNKYLGGNYSCNSAGTVSGTPVATSYGPGSRVLEMRSEAYFVGVSETDATVPALFRERMDLNTSTSTPYTTAEELVQGVENMQVMYGLDTNATPDHLADKYVKANDVTDWSDVVTVRLSLRMRSVYEVYNQAVDFDEFEGVDDTDGSDRYMRQIVTTTIQIRNS